jgi:UDP-N-acetylmuramoyl-L-alanyl-D-glutamate--2,6-diaminopimelate ligase
MSVLAMRLADLFDAPPARAADLDITGLTADSREVRPGFLFAALPGRVRDGATFAAEALARGATAILAQRGAALPRAKAGATVLFDDNPRRALALAAARFHGRQPAKIVGVTGTNGKSSVVEFCRQIWIACGHRAASVGTLGIRVDAGQAFGAYGSGLTTPDPVTLHRALAELADAGFEHVAIEASSHGLDQYRLDGVRFAAAALTNVTRDHLDYHAGDDAYLRAKLRLFTELLPAGSPAILNADADSFAAADAACRQAGRPVHAIGAHGGAIHLTERRPTADGQDIELCWRGREHSVHLPLIGGFQASNALVAAALVAATGEEPQAIVRALTALKGAPGRLECVGRHPNGAAVYVDYAHTPDALETVLHAVRAHARDRLSLVFGCGGDRDRGKRPQMGAIAARLADSVIVADDNPRNEDPAEIRRAILAACPGGREIGDRAAAIDTAVAALEPGDLLIIAGKGHESGQIVGDRTLPFDDRVVARAALARLGGQP